MRIEFMLNLYYFEYKSIKKRWWAQRRKPEPVTNQTRVQFNGNVFGARNMGPTQLCFKA